MQVDIHYPLLHTRSDFFTLALSFLLPRFYGSLLGYKVTDDESGMFNHFQLPKTVELEEEERQATGDDKFRLGRAIAETRQVDSP